MQAVIETRQNGAVIIEFDREAAQAMRASVMFASRFHEGIVPLARTVEAGIGEADRRERCQ